MKLKKAILSNRQWCPRALFHCKLTVTSSTLIVASLFLKWKRKREGVRERERVLQVCGQRDPCKATKSNDMFDYVYVWLRSVVLSACLEKMRFPLPKHYPAPVFRALHQDPAHLTTLPILQIPSGDLFLTLSPTHDTRPTKICQQDKIMVTFLESQSIPQSRLRLLTSSRHVPSPLLPQHMLNTAQQTRLFNYLRSDINCGGNERLCALTAWQKLMLLGHSSTSHSSLCCSSDMAPHSHQKARKDTCHTYRLLSVIKMR